MEENMKYGSVCSGIEAASAAWHPLGWKPQFFSEVEAFPSAVLEHYYPDVPNLGDMTGFKEWPDYDIDVLVGGTPCQSFSVAGLRKGLRDPRGNLALTYLAIADRYRPEWVVWENVPGVLSSHGGRDFGSFLGALAKLGYGWAYRVLDAQYFGVAQRRRRVFVVGHLGDWRRAAAVLFERESLSGNPPPSREAREVAPTIPSRSTAGGGLGTDFDCDGGLRVTHTLKGEGFDASEDGTGRGTPIIPVPSHDPACTLTARDCKGPLPEADLPTVISFHPTQDPISADDGSCHSLSANANATAAVALPALNCSQTHSVRRGMSVRRLTPRECERLQGFPDDYTAIPYRNKPADKCPDGPRYKALGNSMAVPVMQWIGEGVEMS